MLGIRRSPARRRSLALAASFACAITAGPAHAATPAEAALPAPAIPAIVGAFAHHPLVAIAESHGLRQAGDFYIALVRDPAFLDAVNDIVIEFASAQSQPLLDRYVVDGDSLPPDTLRSIWRNTTKTASWEYPTYARWLAALRAVNRGRERSRRVRVLAGDTRVDWARLRSRDDWEALGDNNVTFASVITGQVLAPRHRALVVLGSNHLTRGGDRNGGPNVTTRVDARDPGALYVVWLYTGRPGGDDVEARIQRERWPVPALAPLRGTWAGAIAAGSRRLEDVADALLYLAPARDLVTEMSPPEAFDVAYVDELDRRSWIEWGDSTRARRFLGLPARGADPPNVAKPGDVQPFKVASRHQGKDRQVWVYTPPGYAASRDSSLGLLIAFDGGEYLGDIPLPRILDSLLAAGRIPPLVSVLVDNAGGAARLDDLANRAWFVDWLSDELLPWVRRGWRVTRDPRRVIVTGSSAGGLAATFAALKRPDVFGNVLSQSGAYWRGAEASNDPPYAWLEKQVRRWPHADVRFWLEVGSTESRGALGGAAPSILATNRALRDTLRANGYRVTYGEVPNGVHAPQTWAPRLPVGLVLLAGTPH
jgi:enterochelin esterase family protein